MKFFSSASFMSNQTHSQTKAFVDHEFLLQTGLFIRCQYQGMIILSAHLHLLLLVLWSPVSELELKLWSGLHLCRLSLSDSLYCFRFLVTSLLVPRILNYSPQDILSSLLVWHFQLHNLFSHHNSLFCYILYKCLRIKCAIITSVKSQNLMNMNTWWPKRFFNLKFQWSQSVRADILA
jgi:hypothetical protein